MNLKNLVNGPNYNKNYYIDLLKETNKKLFIYGAQKTAKRIFDILSQADIDIEGFFVDDEYYKPETFLEGKKVFTKSQVLSNYSEFNTVIGFYSYLAYLEVIKEAILTKRGNVVYVPIVDWQMDLNFFNEHVNEFQKTYDWLCDEKSKNVFVAYLKSRILETPKYLCETVTSPQYFDSFVKLSDNETFIDAGAYTGDTVSAFLERVKNKYYKIYAFEADPNNASILNEAYKNNDKIYAIPKGLWSENTTLYFDNGNTTFSKVSTMGANKVDVVTIDSCVKDVSSDVFLKADVEGSELEILKGAKEMIKKHRPKMAICVYHKPNDLITIPQYIKSLNNDYKFYLRHYGIAFYETVLYAL